MIELTLATVCLALILGWVITLQEQSKVNKTQLDRIITEHRADMVEWKVERQQLLDRIQASSFAEYKTQEVRVIKAQNGEKEPPKLEQL